MSGKQVLARKEYDLNFDGKPDVVRRFNDKGQLVADALDLDFDSVPDVKTTYENNLPVRKELDLQFDSKPDVIRKYTKGQLRELKADTDGDGRFDHFELYKRQANQVGVDEDGMDNQTPTNEGK